MKQIKTLNERDIITKTANETQFRVTFVSDLTGFGVTNSKGERVLAGDRILPFDILYTNDSRMEIRSAEGVVFRLGEDSTFTLGDSEIGIRPMINGKVYKYRVDYTTDSGACWKAPTSCWNGCRSTVVFENLDKNKDIYYCLGDSTNIYEFDEGGAKFNIVTIDEGYKCEITFDNTKPMREKYIVTKYEKMADDDFDYVTDRYINGKNWRCQD